MSNRVKTTLFVMITFHFLSILSYRSVKETFRHSSSSSSSYRLYAAKVILEKGKARLFQDGNPLIYGGAVKQVIGDPEPGSEVMVEDHMGNVLGRGVFNPFSQYRVRMLARNHDPAFPLSFDELLFTRISQAGLLRQAIGLPSLQTTVFRLINGEGDRLGGLIVDVMHDTIVAQSSALWVEKHQLAIEQAIGKVIPCRQFIWRRAEARLKQDGYTGDMKDIVRGARTSSSSGASRSSGSSSAPIDLSVPIEEIKTTNKRQSLLSRTKNKSKSSEESISELESVSISSNDHDSGNSGSSSAMAGQNDGTDVSTGDDINSCEVVVLEHGIKYYVQPEDGQKTGFYADQRDNRHRIRLLSHNKTVLDTFCYSGGFALNAALGGATKVTAVDSSKPALDTANKNIVLNGVAHIVTTVKADAIEYMKKMVEEGQTYDMVICDPPKLAPTRTSLEKAKSKYTKINALAMSLVNPGGVLLTCTCSAAMAQSEEFRYMLMDAAKQAKRDLTILSTTGAATDHPVHLAYPEGRYLCAIMACVT